MIWPDSPCILARSTSATTARIHTSAVLSTASNSLELKSRPPRRIYVVSHVKLRPTALVRKRVRSTAMNTSIGSATFAAQSQSTIASARTGSVSPAMIRWVEMELTTVVVSTALSVCLILQPTKTLRSRLTLLVAAFAESRMKRSKERSRCKRCLLPSPTLLRTRRPSTSVLR